MIDPPVTILLFVIAVVFFAVSGYLLYAVITLLHRALKRGKIRKSEKGRP